MDDAGLKEAFSPYGDCEATVMMDKFTGRSRGFGFVTFGSAVAATSAIEAMHNKELDGRALVCNNAKQLV